MAARVGRVLFFALWAVVIAAGATLGIIGVLDADEPVRWGTFTEERCEQGGRYGCRSIGTWVSDDGSIRLDDVYLDGTPTTDGTAAASYQPTGIVNDADNNIVHTRVGTSLEPFVPWMLVAFGVATAASQWREWRRSRRQT